MQWFLELLSTLTTPEKLIHLLSTIFSGWYGYLFLCSVVFVETGLLIGIVLPGDSFLFTIGVVAGVGELNIVAIGLALMAASILGDQLAYYLGYRTGPAIFNRPDSKIFKREYVTQTQEFYAKHGGKTLIYAKFVPVVRAFAPFMAGVGRMNYLRFLSFNVVGGVGWVFSMVTLGYLLGGIPLIRRHFEKVVILVVLVSLVPLLIQYLHSRKTRSAPVPTGSTD
ncbi:MAG: VTT domain-containing protein [Bryobacteraceae bacterium]